MSEKEDKSISFDLWNTLVYGMLDKLESKEISIDEFCKSIRECNELFIKQMSISLGCYSLCIQAILTDTVNERPEEKYKEDLKHINDILGW